MLLLGILNASTRNARTSTKRRSASESDFVHSKSARKKVRAARRPRVDGGADAGARGGARDKREGQGTGHCIEGRGGEGVRGFTNRSTAPDDRRSAWHSRCAGARQATRAPAPRARGAARGGAPW